MLYHMMMAASMGLVGIAPVLLRANDVHELDGEWTALWAERDGREDGEIVGHVLRFEGDTFSIQENGVTIYEGTFEVNESLHPGAIDFVHTGAASKGKTWRGIYRVGGEMLTICDNARDLTAVRPTSFATHPNSGLVLVGFKRATK
jgi:uncharacterized protein (TIGR03067 family)